MARIVFSVDPKRVDFKAVHAYLSERSYWAKGRKAEVQRRANAGSLCAGLYEGSRQAAFARVITDRATFAYVCDLFVLEDFRGRGLGKRLVRELLQAPALRRVRTFTLLTKDAHGLYRKSGYKTLRDPKKFMLLRRTPR